MVMTDCAHPSRRVPASVFGRRVRSLSLRARHPEYGCCAHCWCPWAVLPVRRSTPLGDGSEVFVVCEPCWQWLRVRRRRGTMQRYLAQWHARHGHRYLWQAVLDGLEAEWTSP